MSNPELDYGMHQAKQAADLVTANSDIREAFDGVIGWAATAYDRMTAEGTPSLYAASIILSATNTALMHKLMQP